MSNAVLADLCSALDLVVLERQQGGFGRVGAYALPPWFIRVFIRAQGDGPTLTLTEVFPVLDSFLTEAELFWDQTGDGRLTSEPFLVTDSIGDDVPILVTAVGRNGKRYLIMQPDASFPDRQRILQRARDQALAHERVVRRIQELRQPIASLARLTAGLSEHSTPDETRAAIGSLARQVSTLQRIVGELPQGPRGATPKSRGDAA